MAEWVDIQDSGAWESTFMLGHGELVTDSFILQNINQNAGAIWFLKSRSEFVCWGLPNTLT